MPTLEIESQVQLHYADQGSGETAWLMFNGAGLPLQFWDKVADNLSSEQRVIRFDHRNAGHTIASGHFSLHDVAADAYKLLLHLEVERVLIAGHAWGGRVAQIFARDYPFAVAGMALCGTGGQFAPTADPDLQQHLRQSLRSGNRRDWEDALQKVFIGPGYAQRDPTGFQQISDLLWARPTGQKAKWEPRIAPSESYWGQPQLPTLLLYGSHDHFGTLDNAKDLHNRIAGSQLHIIEDTGHFLIRERHKEVAERLQAFAKQIEEGQR